MIKSLLLIYSFLSISLLGNSQSFIIVEYPDSNAEINVVGKDLQLLYDGDILITSQRHCYTPNVITIEGCPYGRQLIKAKVDGTRLWTQNIYFQWDLIEDHVFEIEGDHFSFLTTEQNSNSCNGWSVWMLGWWKTTSHKVTYDGVYSKLHKYNTSCGLRLMSSLQVEDDKVMMLVYESFDLSESLQQPYLMILDVSLNIIDSIELPVNPDLEYVRLLKIDPQTNWMLVRNKVLKQLVLWKIDNNGTILEIIEKNDLSLATTTKLIAKQATNNEMLLPGYDPISKENGLCKLASNGDTKWCKTYPNLTSTIFYETNNGKILFAGIALNPNTNTDDFKMLILDEEGEILYERWYELDYPYKEIASIVSNKAGEIFILGSANCCNKDTLIGAGFPFLILDTLSGITHIIENNNETVLHICPNPTSQNQLLVKVEDNQIVGNLYFSLFDLHGRVINQWIQNANHNTTYPLELPAGLASGMYIFRLADSSGQSWVEKLVVR